MQEVEIFVNTKQVDLNGNEEKMDFFTLGQYSFGEKRIVIIYDEPNGSGLEGTRTMIVVKEGSVRITRRGAITMTQDYVLDKKHHGTYSVKEGNLRLATFTHHIKSAQLDEGESKYFYHLSFDYDLFLQEELAYRNLVEIKLAKKD